MGEILGSIFSALLKIMAVAVVVGLLYMALHKSKGTTEAANLATLSASIDAAYGGQVTFDGINSSTVASIAPGQMVSGNALVNQWGQQVVVQENGGNSSEFDIQETGVPKKDCVDLVTAVNNYSSLTLGAPPTRKTTGYRNRRR